MYDVSVSLATFKCSTLTSASFVLQSTEPKVASWKPNILNPKPKLKMPVTTSNDTGVTVSKPCPARSQTPHKSTWLTNPLQRAQGVVKGVTSAVGNTVSGVSNTVGGTVGAVGRGLGEVVNGATGGLGKPVGDLLADVGTGVEAGTAAAAKGARDAGQWKWCGAEVLPRWKREFGEFVSVSGNRIEVGLIIWNWAMLRTRPCFDGVIMSCKNS
jgi:hypothetical protein